jgi:hypothetical protein
MSVPPVMTSATTTPGSAPSVSDTAQASGIATGNTPRATGKSAGPSGLRAAGLGAGIIVVFGVFALVVLLTGGVKSGPDRAGYAAAASDFAATIASPSTATTFEDRKAYWAAVATASNRFAARLGAMSFPYPTTSDAARLTAALGILEGRAAAASRLSSVGALLAVESITTQATTDATNLETIVENDLGLAKASPSP